MIRRDIDASAGVVLPRKIRSTRSFIDHPSLCVRRSTRSPMGARAVSPRPRYRSIVPKGIDTSSEGVASKCKRSTRSFIGPLPLYLIRSMRSPKEGERVQDLLERRDRIRIRSIGSRVLRLRSHPWRARSRIEACGRQVKGLTRIREGRKALHEEGKHALGLVDHGSAWSLRRTRGRHGRHRNEGRGCERRDGRREKAAEGR